MCCAFLALFLLGPRIFGAFWWLFQPTRWNLAFSNWFGGALWWIWPILGLVFLPWTTIMYIIVAPGGVAGWDWLWPPSRHSSFFSRHSCSNHHERPATRLNTPPSADLGSQ